MTDDELERWATGVELEDGRTLPAHMHFLRHEEGKTCSRSPCARPEPADPAHGEATGFPVMRLARTSFAGITSEGLRPGSSGRSPTTS